MTITWSDKFIAWLTLLSGLSISAVAVWYSVAGLISIFAAAVIPIAIMGCVLEVGKLVATVWLKQNWVLAPRLMRVYLLSAIIILMAITSMGIFGFLSKAHMDQNLVSGDVQSKISIYDEKIRIARENIDANRRALKQLDEAVDQVMGRSTTESGAERSVQIRRQQGPERQRLIRDIETEQKKISDLNEARAPIAAEVRKVEAEVGPIKYIAALIYGDNPEANLLERAVRWVIIIIVVVFDPLAVVLLLASQYSFTWFRNNPMPKTTYPDYPPDDGPLNKEQIDQIRKSVEIEQTNKIDKENKQVEQVYLNKPWIDKVPGIRFPYQVYRPDNDKDPDEAVEDVDLKLAIKNWKEANPNDTMKNQRRLLAAKKIDQLPWLSPQYLISSVGFGSVLPETGVKGSQFILTSSFPNKLYKNNGTSWIQVDREQNNTYIYNTEYIRFLIKRIESGEYDIEQLTDAEREQIEIYLKDQDGK